MAACLLYNQHCAKCFACIASFNTLKIIVSLSTFYRLKKWAQRDFVIFFQVTQTQDRFFYLLRARGIHCIHYMVQEKN